MKRQEAERLGNEVMALVRTGNTEEAYSLLSPVLEQRTPFALLGRTGDVIGSGSLKKVNAFLDRVASERTMGGGDMQQ